MKKSSRNIKHIKGRVKDFANELFSDDLIEIHSNRLVFVTGCKRISEYSPSKIRLSFKRMEVVIEGADLEPESLINGEMAVRGTVREVKYADILSD